MDAGRRKFLQASGTLIAWFALPVGAQPDSIASGSAIFGNRISIDASGGVSLFLGKVELGQGIGTALAQLAAEELCVAFERLALAAVDTNYSPDESYTFSSISVQQSGPPLREAAAACKQFLLKRAADVLAVSITKLSVEDGVIYLDGKPSRVDYWQLLTDDHVELEITSDDPQKPVADYKVVGSSVPRIDIPDKVFGESSFLQDLRLPKMLHARVVRPDAPRAKLAGIETLPVEEMPGVVKVIVDGNFVAVVAEREGIARAAAEALQISIAWSTPGDLPGDDMIYDWLKEAPSRVESVAKKGGESPADALPQQFSATYRRPYQAHGSISPSAAVALFEDDKLTVWSHAQGMYPLRTAIAHTLDLNTASVRCVHMEAAGCYGHNGADDAACDAAAIAVQVPGRPIRLQWERADEFKWEPYGAAMQIEAHAALDASGRIRNWQYDLWSCPHASRPRSTRDAGHLLYAQHRLNPLDIPLAASIPQPNGGSDRNAVPLYSFDNVQVTKHLVTAVPLRVSSLRGLGAYANVFSIESFMDEIAAHTDADPLGYRLRHLNDRRAIELLEYLAEVSHWANRPDVGTGEGWGMGFAKFKNLSSYVGIVYQLAVDNESGRIELRRATAVCDAGLVINPDGVRAQIEGGIVQSSSWTLKEQLKFSSNEIQSRDWASYPILRFDEVPEVNVHLMDRSREPSLGVGEAAQGPTAAAIGNAIYHATRRRYRDLPFTPERIKAAAA